MFHFRTLTIIGKGAPFIRFLRSPKACSFLGYRNCHLYISEIFFNPEHPTSEIGYLFSMNCTVSGVSDLTSIHIARGEPAEDVCSANDGGITNSVDYIACTGELNSDTGTIQIEFSAVKCDDEGYYFCEANDDASTSTRTSLTVTSMHYTLVQHFIHTNLT